MQPQDMSAGPAAPEAWSLKTAFHLFVAMAGYSLAVLIALVIAGAVLRGAGFVAAVAEWAPSGIFLTLELVWLRVLWRYRHREGVKPLWRWDELRSGYAWATVAVAVMICIGANAVRLVLLQATGEFWRAAIALAGRPIHWGPTLVTLAAAVVLAPLAEEWFFRGILQGALSRRWGPVIAIAVTAAVFGLMHGLTDLTVVAVYGVVFGWLAHRRESLTLSLVVHGCVNLTALGVPVLIQLLGR